MVLAQLDMLSDRETLIPMYIESPLVDIIKGHFDKFLEVHIKIVECGWCFNIH